MRSLSINFIGNTHRICQKTEGTLTWFPPIGEGLRMDFDKLFEEASRRRWWLLTKALECSPLDRALDLARVADQFILAGPDADGVGGRPPLAISTPRSEPTDVSTNDGRPSETACGIPAAKTSRLMLAPHRRDQLLERLAQGARNAELATEFGLTPQQVQGLRMAAARKRQPKRPEDIMLPEDPTVSGRMDDVVRYLRQQDDVVVAERDGFLVNGRFHLGPSELVARANRIRQRQNKLPFKIDGIEPEAPAPEPPRNANGHPLFWPSGGSERDSAVGSAMTGRN
jgi:hypothetical protein